ncbi:conserved hypothetical protein (DUF1566) [Formosa agariphila KMM 3901]|uniref:Lcl C-terminal domain-containing protein n=1 Tax=Formosa agariphila (strain DSM 15362 / KCTC 12365 / LMG 23005 / KMM 3901 / M-2Alg 35-1) TaxID=1347342 RepID=T2KLX7_FORAG|nr:DUF1566 domain-containing protein [Formosa agariphila]CDF79468.1 conserved hypothetical protein (DUF1566) [Formosa agariphila KMM 3901]
MNFEYLKTTFSLLAVCSIMSCGDDTIDTADNGEDGGGEIGFTGLSYEIVDTGVLDFYDNDAIITASGVGDAFYGQDATYMGNQPSYTDNGDGTVTDNVTGLIWQQNMGDKMSYADAVAFVETFNLGGYSDWRIPTIKELYSLSNFTGRCFGDDAVDMFIDVDYFDQPIGDESIGEREIDGQTWSITEYVGRVMNGDEAVFGFNFVDGRLKSYPKYSPATGAPNTMYFRMVRGNTAYGENDFTDNGNGTITDHATGLMWQQADNGENYDWEHALAYAESLTLGGHSDWRMPNAKELQSIVDYTRSPQTTNSPAIAPLFTCTSILDYNGNPGQYGYYWSSSPLQDGPTPYTDAVYFCFGEAEGLMNGQLLDVHGAGAQRNDPKAGSTDNFPDTFGPQGDIRKVYNFIRCVRDTN